MFADLLEGLTSIPKKTSPKYFYDAAGSKLFDQITELDAYYPTRTEMGIMQAEIKKMAKAIGPDALLIEFGSGSSLKTRLLLDHLDDLAGYVPIDISEAHLLETAAALRLLYPDVEILPVAADYTKPFDIPEPSKAVQKRVVYFPGSTIGNFEPSEAQAFLQQAAQVAGPAGSLLIGVDLKKDRETLERAYDDPEGVTAAFNLNLVHRINRELAGSFDPAGFRHEAVWNEAEGRVEMHLVSLRDQTPLMCGRPIPFYEGERWHTESSYKYTLDGFATLAAPWFTRRHVWTDDAEYFSVQFFDAK